MLSIFAVVVSAPDRLGCHKELGRCRKIAEEYVDPTETNQLDHTKYARAVMEGQCKNAFDACMTMGKDGTDDGLLVNNGDQPNKKREEGLNGGHTGSAKDRADHKAVATENKAERKAAKEAKKEERKAAKEAAKEATKPAGVALAAAEVRGADRDCESLLSAPCCSCKMKVCNDEAAEGGTCSDEADSEACCENKRDVCITESQDPSGGTCSKGASSQAFGNVTATELSSKGKDSSKGEDRDCMSRATLSNCCNCKMAVCNEEAAEGGTCHNEADPAACCTNKRDVCITESKETHGTCFMAGKGDATRTWSGAALHSKGEDRNCETMSGHQCCNCKMAVCNDEAAEGGTCSNKADPAACCAEKRDVCVTESMDGGTCSPEAASGEARA